MADNTVEKNKKNNSIWSQSIPVHEQLAVVWRLIKMATPAYWMFAGAILFALISTLISGYLPYILQNFMNKQLTNPNTPLNAVISFALGFGAIQIFSAILTYFQNFWYGQASETALNNVRKRLYAKLHQLGMRYFDQVPGGALVTRVMNDTESFFDFWMLLVNLIYAVASIISVYIFMFASDPGLSYWLLLIVPVTLLTIWVYQKYSSSVYRNMRAKLSALNAKLAESINGIETIQNFHQETRMKSEFEKINQEYFDARFHMVKMDSRLLGPMNQLLLGMTTVFILWYLGNQSFTAAVAGGTIYAFTNWIGNIFNPLNNVQQSLSTFQDGVVSGYRAGKILDDTTYEPAQNENANGKITDGKIEFRHVDFSYDGKTTILHDLSFTAEPGQTIALVGHTGSGKSSTINALMRFYEFQKGSILIDGQDIRDLDPVDFREKMGLVLQDSFMFYGDINSNIRMYDDSITDQQIVDAARFVDADKFIDSLPHGYKTPVLEGGSSLSAGQKQLISFARTIVRDPKILILDEATANIDTQTEAAIQRALKNMRTNRTTIAIAHRLSTIKDADLILVLDKGVVVEQGTHRQLLAQKGYYYDLYKMQSMENAGK
ncbi:MAG: ABC transporter ATP-binding protein [Oenococcus sp.]|uniref:ABC transporter ATP-binding protein n=1 Tax=Oenococcus TaxID=46254 RepID=UPI0021E8CEAF|nr:ABC transporter ATP-binding protein [Oenococcus kitaharae]MCV3296443.1 ABC transporter ATP-binding protein/permease [Oenococcus kitaharae]